MNRNIIIKETDFDILSLKLDYIAAISELLISDMSNSEYGDETLVNSIGAISMMTNELHGLLNRTRIAAWNLWLIVTTTKW